MEIRNSGEGPLNSSDEAQRMMIARGEIAESIISSEKPHLLQTFRLYQNEAVEARILLEDSLLQVKDGGEVLEVGGGILALAVQLASEGFKVTTVEPIAEGFSSLDYILNVYLRIASEQKIELEFLNVPIEECRFDKKFDFIYSINVMEHLRDPYFVIRKLAETLSSMGQYRFICPNYDFPYEPHFAKWLIRRSHGAFTLEKRRARSKQIPFGEELVLLHSLNFLTLRKITKELSGTKITVQAEKLALYKILTRFIGDSELKSRHPSINTAVKIIVFFRIHHVFRFMPVNFQPLMDVRISNSGN